MNMTNNLSRRPLLLAVAITAAVALSACGKSDQNASPVPGTPPPAAATVMPPAAVPMGNNAPATVSVTSVDLGSAIDANNHVAASDTSFAPSDKIYASVITNGTGNVTLDVKWTYQDGQVVHEDSKTLDTTGEQATAFMIDKPSGFPAGDYKVDVSMNGSSVASKDFSVKK